MRIGLHVPSFSYPGGPEQIGPVFGRIAHDADQAGLHSFWTMDHFFQIRGVGRPEEPMLECYSTLSYAAALTERITLGAMVTGVVYRYPGVLVKTVTTLDVLSGGRAWLGIGAAWNEEECGWLGVPFPPVAERFERLEETLRLARQMFAGDDSPYEGRHYRLERPLNSPPPLRRPRPPILIGGGGERKTLRLVARYGDACNLFAMPGLAHKLEVLRGHCEREGRSYEEIEKTALYTMPPSASADQTIDRCAALAEQGIDHVVFSQPDAHEPRVVRVLAEVVERTGEIVPAGH